MVKVIFQKNRSARAVISFLVTWMLMLGSFYLVDLQGNLYLLWILLLKHSIFVFFNLLLSYLLDLNKKRKLFLLASLLFVVVFNLSDVYIFSKSSLVVFRAIKFQIGPIFDFVYYLPVLPLLLMWLGSSGFTNLMKGQNENT
jgi:hypothetical protein